MAVRAQSTWFGVAAPDRHASGPVRGICLPDLPTRLDGGLPPLDLPRCVPPSLVSLPSGTGILTSCPSPTTLVLGLGPTHPQLMTIAAEPCDIRWEGFTPSSRYSYRHSHSWPLHQTFQSGFSADHDAPLPFIVSDKPAASVVDLSPGHCRRSGTLDQ